MIFVSHAQNTPAWERWREDKIGGSDAGPIMRAEGVYTSRERLLLEKATRMSHGTNFQMEKGKRLEPVIRDMYAFANDVTDPILTPCGEHETLRWMSCSLDGLIERTGMILEIKYAAWTMHDMALNGIVPEKYIWQCQHNLYVSGMKECHYVSYNDGKKFPEHRHLAPPVVVRPNREMIRQLIEAETAFREEVLAMRRANAYAPESCVA